MFTYCINNPVNGYDPCGTCLHRWDFWNDCEKCGGKSFGKKWDECAVSLYESHMMQIESQRRVDEISFNFLKNSAIVVTKAIAESIEIQNNAQRRQDQIVYDFVKDRFSTHEKTSNSLGFMLSLTEVGAASYTLGKTIFVSTVPGAKTWGAAFWLIKGVVNLWASYEGILAEKE